ncbi:hypothetical protein PACTADRAFT_73223 [Pachysolen tannophilus NRRL Y-2460]|uniref:Derlin n=1 Tax=Pachysolen tannophilus NRRL Y-2460 TaxID=669874 RepID=A0A1E4U0H3_PACTA|nr:hypothetical protein PACTADRAFT_73223 [Pachysolen tannophilus NRRL Y-2460]
MSELRQFVSQIPPITRILTLTSLSVAGLFSIDIVKPVSLICYWPLVIKKYQFWRLITSFFVCNIHDQPMQSLMDLYMIYSYSRGLEENKFINIADYIFYYVIVTPLILFTSPWTSALSLQSALLSALTYTWSIANRNQQVNFYFITMKAAILPAVSLGFRLLLNGKQDFLQAFVGMLAAYLYNCLETSTLGPLMSLIKKDSNQTTKRVGTLNSLNSNTYIEELYYDGYLPAPSWLRKLITGSPNVAYVRPRNNFSDGTPLSSDRSPTGRTTSSNTSFTSRTTAFRGKGYRLGN